MTLTGDKKREYQRQWVASRRTAFFEGKSCSYCGSTNDLELDHIDRNTKIDHKIWSWSAERRDAEIAKCQVLCYDCHKAKTRKENLVLEHGTYAMRNQHGCDCELCKAYVRNIKAAWRKRTGRH